MPTPSQLNAVLPADLRVVKEIAHGGQRTVYEARRADDRVCLKLMRCREGGLERAQRETEIGYVLQHPNLVRIYDPAPMRLRLNGKNYCYFTEEYVEGETLHGKLGGWAACDALDLVEDLADAAGYLWNEHQVVHRDINPKNIIRHPKRRYVLLDVGYGRHQAKSALTHPSVRRGPGTTGYLSPEQLSPTLGSDLDYRSDLFQIGIVCYEALSGELPFNPREGDYEERLQRGEADVSHLPDELAQLLRRLLAPEPHRRPRGASQALKRVHEAKEALRCF